eukprot:SAG11_NODE_20031_length_454_cov_0.585915_1_plen_132_part_01
MEIEPPVSSSTRKSVSMSDDLPLPVRPQTPTFLRREGVAEQEAPCERCPFRGLGSSGRLMAKRAVGDALSVGDGEAHSVEDEIELLPIACADLVEGYVTAGWPLRGCKRKLAAWVVETGLGVLLIGLLCLDL